MIVLKHGALHEKMLLQLMRRHDFYTTRTDGPFYPVVVFNFVQLSCLFLEFSHIGRKAVVHTEMNIFSPSVRVNFNRHLSRCQSDKLAMIHCVTLDLFRNLQHRDSEKQGRLKLSSWVFSYQNFENNLRNSVWGWPVVTEQNVASDHQSHHLVLWRCSVWSGVCRNLCGLHHRWISLPFTFSLCVLLALW